MARQILNLGTPTRGVDLPGAESRYESFRKTDENFAELYGPLVQDVVPAATTRPLTAAHIGATIILNGTGATVSGSATTLGDGFVCLIRNRTGSDWTVPTLTGGTLEFEEGGTKIPSGKSATVEILTRNATRYVVVTGATI